MSYGVSVQIHLISKVHLQGYRVRLARKKTAEKTEHEKEQEKNADNRPNDIDYSSAGSLVRRLRIS